MEIMDYIIHDIARIGISYLELAKLYFQDKLEYYLTCNISSNKLKFAIIGAV